MDENHLISEINLWLPSPYNDQAYLIDDLTGLIGTKPSHHIEIEQDLRSVLENQEEQRELDATSYGIVLPGEDKSQ